MPLKIDDKILMSVEKPSRYTGGEWNSVEKNPTEVEVRFAFCFPDVYEIGMSHLGIKILYHMMNDRTDTYCERVFAPWVDMEKRMRENGIPLFSVETKTPINEFDIVGFTLQYEMSYTNIINMLDLGNVPLYSKDREESHPFVCAGGPCAYNPEPLADFVDFFIMGEGEEVNNEVLDCYIEWKKSGQKREAFLEQVSTIKGIYVPSFYKVTYNQDGTIAEFGPIDDKFPTRIRKRIIKDLNTVYYPDKFVVPYNQIVHDRIMLELFRGCVRGCRFCQAGYVYRPVREKKVEKLSDCAKTLINSTGYEEISLTSLSTSDYTEFQQLAQKLIEITQDKRINLALPSTRVDSVTISLLDQIQKVRKSGLTLAPEAGSQRLRDVINKGITHEQIIESVSLAFRAGWNNVKLYFMIGLPTETYEDLDGIVELAHAIVDEYYKIPKQERAKGLNVTVSVSNFVPKPFTAFQWERQDTIEVLAEKHMYLKDRLKHKNITFNWHDSKLSSLEAIFSRGDRRIGQVLKKAWENGCKFDAWNEFFKYDTWIKTFEETGIDPKYYANRKRSTDEILPWSVVDVGVSNKFFKAELEKSKKAETTPNCRQGCSGCGAAVFEGGVCVE